MFSAALRTVAAAWLALTLAFFAMRALPGDAISAQLMEAGLGAEVIAERRASLGLDRPVTDQYLEYINRLLRADLGRSLYTGEAVMDVIVARAGSTLALAVNGLGLMLLLSISLAAGANRSGIIGHVSRLVLLGSIGLPSYVTGTLVVLLFGLADPDSAAGVLTSALVLGFHAGGSVAYVLSESIRFIRLQPYVAAAHARGLPSMLIEVRHVLRNAILPVLPHYAVQAGFLLGGTVITEVVFARPGLGRLMLDAVLRRDLPVVQGLTLLAAVTYCLCLLAADLLARLLDPRPRE